MHATRIGQAALSCAVILTMGAAVAAVAASRHQAAGGSPAAQPPGTGRLTEGPAGPPARLPDGRIARPPAYRGPLAVSHCPRPPYGPQYYAPGRAKTVALTFDDGPGRTTSRILAILRRQRVPATFFNIGENEAARPSLVREEGRDGFAIGNHTWDHPDMALLTRREQAAELYRTSIEQKSLTGFVPCVFRPPYGDYNSTTLSLARHRRLAVWMWSVDTQDWMADGSGSSYWVHRIIRLAEEEGGALRNPVVLMHNQPTGNPATAKALPTIIRFFRAHHYRFVVL
ncbi:MAG: polysaccharide deacetylase family protein [Streptosporangiaceae bacterium]